MGHIQFLLIMNNIAINIHIRFLCEHEFSRLGKIAMSEVARSYESVHLTV